MVRDLPARLRELEVPGSMQSKHQTATDLILELAVGLSPVPVLARFNGQSIAAEAGVLSNEFPQEDQIDFSDLSTAKTQDHIGHVTRSVESGILNARTK